MSKQWQKDHDIQVSGKKTVNDVFKGSAGMGNNRVINYLTGGTCIGVANRAGEVLTREKPDYNNPGHLMKSIVQHNQIFDDVPYDPKDYFDNAPGSKPKK